MYPYRQSPLVVNNVKSIMNGVFKKLKAKFDAGSTSSSDTIINAAKEVIVEVMSSLLMSSSPSR